MKHLLFKLILSAFILSTALHSFTFAQAEKDARATIVNSHKDSTVSDQKRTAVLKKRNKSLRVESQLEKNISDTKQEVIIGKNFNDNILLRRPNMPYFESDTLRKFKFKDSLFIPNGFDTMAMRRYRKDRIAIAPHGDHSIKMPNVYREMDMRGLPPRPFQRNKPNSQSFTYKTMDEHGIETNITLMLSEASAEQLEKIQGSATDKDLEVKDLTLVPNFSSNKMTISFNLSSKANTTVSILDADFKTIFSERVNTNQYLKQIDMLNNGTFFIYIKQQNASVVKQLIKQ